MTIIMSPPPSARSATRPAVRREPESTGPAGLMDHPASTREIIELVPYLLLTEAGA